VLRGGRSFGSAAHPLAASAQHIRHAVHHRPEINRALVAAALRWRDQWAGAGLDVWEHEPPPHDHPLMAFDNVIVSPHVAGSTIEARETMGRIAAEQVLGILDGKKPPRLINPEVWSAYRDRFERIMGFAPEADQRLRTTSSMDH
jgi:D-isomer specific 2-hydroxyacid dehydrogenase, NAD binding domain